MGDVCEIRLYNIQMCDQINSYVTSGGQAFVSMGLIKYTLTS